MPTAPNKSNFCDQFLARPKYPYIPIVFPILLRYVHLLSRSIPRTRMPTLLGSFGKWIRDCALPHVFHSGLPGARWVFGSLLRTNDVQ